MWLLRMPRVLWAENKIVDVKKETSLTTKIRKQALFLI